MPPVEKIATPCSFNFLTIGPNPSLLNTDIRAEEIFLEWFIFFNKWYSSKIGN